MILTERHLSINAIFGGWGHAVYQLYQLGMARSANRYAEERLRSGETHPLLGYTTAWATFGAVFKPIPQGGLPA